MPAHSQIMRILAATALFLAVFSTHVRPTNHFEKGIFEARDGDLERAIDSWSSAIKKNPRDYGAYVNRGSAHMQMGYVLKGVRDWNKAVNLSPPFAYAVFTGDAVRNSFRAGSLLGFVVSLEIDPDYVASVVMMATNYIDLGQTDLAKELYSKSVDLTRNPLLKSHLESWSKSLDSQGH